MLDGIVGGEHQVYEDDLKQRPELVWAHVGV